MNSFLRDSFSVGLSKGVIILSGLGTAIVTARVLGPDKNGLVAALIVIPSLFLSFGSLGIRQSTTYLVGKEKYSDEELKRGITQIWFLTTILSLILCFGLMRFVGLQDYDVTYIYLALAPIPFKLFNTYNSGFFLGKNNIKVFNRINWVPAVAVFLSTFVLLVIFKMDILGYLLAMMFGPMIISVILFFKDNLIKHLSLKVNLAVIKSLLFLGVVYAVALLVINLNYKFDILMLKELSSSFELGIYSKGASITEFLWHIPMLLSTIVFARSAASKDDEAFSRKVAKLLRISFLFIAAGSVVLWLLSKYIIVGMYGSDFFESVSVLNYLLPGVVLLTIYKVMNMDLAGKGKPWVAIIAMVPALIINVVLNYYFIPEYGADGSAIASTISYSFAALLFLVAYSKSVKVPILEIITYKKEDFSIFRELAQKLKKGK